MDRALVLSGGGARGAFQAGVWEYLVSKNWVPDLICGTSIGAINASAIGSGKGVEEINRLWANGNSKRVYRLTVRRFLKAFLGRRKFSPLMNTDPLKVFIEEHVDFKALRRSPISILISAINMETSEVEFFSHKEIEIEHLMATSAIPLLFPWKSIGKTPYWDGGIMCNIPVMPAIESKAKEIVVVLLSPVGAFRQKAPKNHREAMELLLEHFLFGSYNMIVRNMMEKDTRIHVVAPTGMLGLGSLLNFSPEQAKRLLREGRVSARRQLGALFP